MSGRLKCALVAVVGALSVSFAVPASATIAGMTYSGLSYTPEFGAAHISQVTADIDTYLNVNDVVYLGRVDGGVFDASAILNGVGAVMTGSFTGTAGTWSFTTNTGTYEIVALEVSGGSKSKIYTLDPLATSGNWNTYDIVNGGGNHPNLSHLDFYGYRVKTPEPATLALFAGGLAAFGLRRRKKS
jgi:hypothetical protein